MAAQERAEMVCRRRWKRLLLLIVAAALLLRLAVLAVDTPMAFEGDEPDYVSLAQNIARSGQFQITSARNPLYQGGRPGEPTGYRNIVLPALLAAHYRVFGFTQTPPRLTMALIGALSCALIGVLGRQLFSPAVGLWAAGAWAIWPPSFVGPYAAHRFTPEHVAIALLLGSLVALASLQRAPRPGAWVLAAALAGVLLGLAVLTRGYLLFALPLLWAWVWLLPVAGRRRLGAAFACASCLVVGAWVLRNARALGKPVLSTQTEAFYFGNQRTARGSLDGDLFTLGARSPQIQFVVRRHPDFWRMSEVQRSQMWTREGILAVKGNPRRAVWLAFRKTAIFLSPLQYWTAGPYSRHYFYVVALLLAPLGILASWRTNRRALALLLAPFLACYAAALLTYGLDRYRYTVEPAIVLVACAGAASLLEAWQRRPRRA